MRVIEAPPEPLDLARIAERARARKQFRRLATTVTVAMTVLIAGGVAAARDPQVRPTIVATEPEALEVDPSASPSATSSPRPRPTEGCRVEQPAERRCAYRATRPGCYEADGSGSWAITIERGDETIVILGETSPRCGATGTILPGDLVTLESGRRPTAVGGLDYGGHTSVAAGTEYGLHCDGSS